MTERCTVVCSARVRSVDEASRPPGRSKRETDMADILDPVGHQPSATDRDELPTAYGGDNHEKPTEPGQSIGQEPDTDDDEGQEPMQDRATDPQGYTGMDNGENGTDAGLVTSKEVIAAQGDGDTRQESGRGR